MGIRITKQDILNVIKDVPAKDFLPYFFTNEKDKCCTIGHYNRLTSDDPTDYSATNCCGFEKIPHILGSKIQRANNKDPDNIKKTIITFLSKKR